MDIANRTPLAWIRSQRQQARRPWEGTQLDAQPRPVARTEAPRTPAASTLPEATLVKTLLG